ncbi:pilus assembly protein [Micrococcales bacterium 31B]|nr:pilus assembly protein [Micrococcales bacterium 31B]
MKHDSTNLARCRKAVNVGRRRCLGLRGLSSERGAAVAEFALVSILMMLMFLGLLQLGFALYVRNVSVDSAMRGARVGAVLGGNLAEAEGATRAGLGGMLRMDLVQDVTAQRVEREGNAYVEVTVIASLPVVGPLGPGGTLKHVGRALDEESLR